MTKQVTEELIHQIAGMLKAAGWHAKADRQWEGLRAVIQHIARELTDEPCELRPPVKLEDYGPVIDEVAPVTKEAWDAMKLQGASRDASPAIGPPLCNCQDGECHGPDVAQAYGHLCRAEDEPKPFCAKHPNTAFADTGCPFCGTPPTSRTGAVE